MQIKIQLPKRLWRLELPKRWPFRNFWLPAPAVAPKKVPKRLLNGTKLYRFGKKAEAASRFSETITVSELLRPTPYT